MTSTRPPVVVTGANGLVGRRISETLSGRGIPVRAVVRRAGTAPGADGIEELVGEFTNPQNAATMVAGASALVTTVHPMGSDRETQERIGVHATAELARAAADAGVARLVHISTAAVYDRSPGGGDVDESAALVGDDANDYAVTKRDLDRALAGVDGITRILVRPPAILGPGPSSVWNTLRPREMRDDPDARHGVADATFAWIHVSDLASLVADLASGAIADSGDPGAGPVAGGCVAVNAARTGATQRDYFGAVTGALGVDPIWEPGPGWTGQILTDRARAWGWTPAVELDAALAELVEGLSSGD